MILNIIFVYMLTLSTLVASTIQDIRNEYISMTEEQKSVLRKSYRLGKEFNVGYSLAAIAWQESMAGKYTINLQTKDCGIYQKNIPYYIKSINTKRTSFKENILCKKFIDDMEFAASVAISDLLWWKQNNTWWSTWSKYHCGYGKCDKYAKDIWIKIQVLREEM